MLTKTVQKLKKCKRSLAMIQKKGQEAKWEELQNFA